MTNKSEAVPGCLHILSHMNPSLWSHSLALVWVTQEGPKFEWEGNERNEKVDENIVIDSDVEEGRVYRRVTCLCDYQYKSNWDLVGRQSRERK